MKSKNTHTFFVDDESFCKYELFNDHSLEIKNYFSNIYLNDMIEISDEKNVYDFCERNLIFDGKHYEVKQHLTTNYESLPDNCGVAKSSLSDCRNN